MDKPFAPGDRIELLAMPDDPRPVRPGTFGTVEWVQDLKGAWCRTGQVWQVGVKWDDGRTLMLVVPPDRARKI